MRIRSFGSLIVAIAASVGGAQAAVVHWQGTWETTLLGRDIVGHSVAASSNTAVFLYDTTLNITWLRNANVNGVISWSQANNWIAGLNSGSGFDGFSDWRLPTLTPVNGIAFRLDFSTDGSSDYGYGANGAGWGTASEMGHLFYVTLGVMRFCQLDNLGLCTQDPTWAGERANSGDFQNMQWHEYWTGSEQSVGHAWTFANYLGVQRYQLSEDGLLFAMAVRSGDVLAAPEPPTYAMLLAGLGGLGVIVRRRRQG